MAVKRPEIHFESVEELLGVPQMQDGTELVKVRDIFPFKDHPFKVVDDEKMDELVESIRTNGVLTPVLIRPRSEGGYEMVSGHRRLHAAEKAGLDKIPSIIKEMSDDEAVIAMVDSNVQREEILPSERAWSLKMKMDATRRQGARTDVDDTCRTECDKLGTKTATIVGESVGLKARQVQKYIRLTELVPPLLDLVDEKKIAISMAVDMSYFNEEVQGWLLDYYKTNGKITLKQIRQKSEARRICTMETIEIGAVMLDDNLQEISSFRTYVKPEYNDGIVKKISRLTGITDDMVVNAPNFNDALRMFTNWCLGTGDDVTIYAWSESDYGQISKEMLLKGYEVSEQEAELLGNAWSDFQQEFDSHLGFERQLSLKMALDMAGVDFSGREHDALDDARNTAELLQIFRDEELFNKTLRKIKEYMEPTEIGNTIGSLIDFSAFACA